MPITSLFSGARVAGAKDCRQPPPTDAKAAVRILTPPGERTDGRTGVSRYIDTWAWLDCRWQVISAQITSLPP